MSTAIETVVPLALSKADVNALRLADDVHAHFSDGEHYLIAVKRLTEQERERNPFRTEDPKVTILVNGRTDVYGNNMAMRHGYATVQSRYGTGSGIPSILKAGDRIQLLWGMGAGTNENLRSIGWEGDELDMVVIRANDELGRKPLRFVVDRYSGPNNSARMCRSHP